MKILCAFVVTAVAALLAGPAMAEGYGITCGTPNATGNITILITAPDGSSETHVVAVSSSDTASDKAANIRAYVNLHSIKFAASGTGTDAEFSMAGTPPQPVVKNCGFVTNTAEGADLLRHNSVPLDGKDGIVKLTGTPSTGMAYAGIPGVAVASVSTSSYSTALAVLNALDASLATQGLTGAYVNGSNELVIPITAGTAITWGTTDVSLISGAEIR